MSDAKPTPEYPAEKQVATNGEDAQSPRAGTFVVATADLYISGAETLATRAHVRGDLVPKQNVERYKDLGWADKTEPLAK